METENTKRPQIEVICENNKCGKHFMKNKSEVKRNKKRGSHNYCSLSCSGTAYHKQLRSGKLNAEFLKNITKADKYTGLREHFRRVKYRSRNFNITLDDLLEQWNKQDGICPYSGVKLIHPIRIKDEGLIYMASLDRIDSRLGYIKGNIQFISAAANMAKNNMTHEQMLEFCGLIAKNIKINLVN